MATMTKAMERCPHCGHSEIVTVVNLRTDKAITKGLVNKLKLDLPLLFYKSICRECNKNVVNKIFFCTDGRFSKYEQRMEYHFFFEGTILANDLPPTLSSEPGRVTIYWKCKRCLGTWSKCAGAGDFKICPRCGMRSLVRIIYGDQEGKIAEAAERNEVRLGGRVDDPDNPQWACLECDMHL